MAYIFSKKGYGLRGNSNVLFLNVGTGYMGVFIVLNSLSCTLMCVIFNYN